MTFKRSRRRRPMVAAGCLMALAMTSGCSAIQDDSRSTQAANQASSATTTHSNDGSAAPEKHQNESPGAVLNRYFDAIGAGRFADAYTLWQAQTKGAPASPAELKSRYAHVATIQLQITGNTHTEGAAGTVYATVPITISEWTDSGSKRSLFGQCVLARSNNVPGSSAAQRRWHLHSCDLS